MCVCVCVVFVMRGCFGNMCACIFCVLYCFFYVYSFYALFNFVNYVFFVMFMYYYCYARSALYIQFSSCQLALFGYPD